MKNELKKLNTFFILWSTQSLSQLGSAMTNFALTLWIYEMTGSALQTAVLSICSYAPYVLMSIFAGTLSDQWDKKKTMLICDMFAACCSVVILFLIKTDSLLPIHIYVLNVLSGLMNTVQQPASDVAMTLIIPREQYQRTSGLRSFSNSLVTILHPVLATTLFSFAGMDGVIFVDLFTFIIAFMSLLFLVQIPSIEKRHENDFKESFWVNVKDGIQYLQENRLILVLILFLAGVNLVASAFDAVLSPYVLSNTYGNEKVLGVVTACAGIAAMLGGLLVTVLPAPKDRIRVIYITMLFSLGTENFILAFLRKPVWWCLAQMVGWLPVPVMNANLDVILRSTIPPEIQGRVYSCRNTLQFFTIPIGTFMGGFMVDKICEPWMAAVKRESFLARMFGIGKGSGAALMMFILGVLGIIVCLGFSKVLGKYRFEESIEPCRKIM